MPAGLPEAFYPDTPSKYGVVIRQGNTKPRHRCLIIKCPIATATEQARVSFAVWHTWLCALSAGHILAYSSHLKGSVHSSLYTSITLPLHILPGSLLCLGQWLLQRGHGLIRLWRAHWSSVQSIRYWLLLDKGGEVQHENQSQKVRGSSLGNRL